MANILVCDSISDMKDVYDTILRDCGHKCVFCANPQNVFKYINKGGVEIFIISVELDNDIDGFKLLGMIQEKLAAAVVIMVATIPTTSEAMQAIRKGACDYIAKPIQAVELKKAIDNALKVQSKLLS